ncbi:hypothetical protein As57867_006290, partial [Aphanomyces stellatus]
MGLPKSTTEDVWSNHMDVAAAILDDNVNPSNMLQTSINVATVQAALAPLKDMCDFLAKTTSIDQVYERLLDMEADVVASDTSRMTYAHVVMRYCEMRQKPMWKTTRDAKKPLKTILGLCPHDACRGRLPLALMFDIHVQGASRSCPHCQATLNYRMFQLGEMLRLTTTIRVRCAQRGNISVTFPPLPRDGSLATFLSALAANFPGRCATAYKSATTQLLGHVNTVLHTHLNGCVGAMSCDLVHVMLQELRQLCTWNLTVAICANFEYWNRPQVIRASIVRYHKFMSLIQHCGSWDRHIETFDIAIISYVHSIIFDQFLEEILRGSNLKLDPAEVVEESLHIPLAKVADSLAHTYNAWKSHFGEAYLPCGPPFTKHNFERLQGDPMLPLKLCKTTTAAYSNPFRHLTHDKFRFCGIDTLFGPPKSTVCPVILPVIGTPYMKHFSSLQDTAPILLELNDRWQTAPDVNYADGWTA